MIPSEMILTTLDNTLYFFYLAIRDMSTKDVICYECIVGGTCGFLSRERQRMLLHISKHFQVGDGSQPDFDGEQLSDDSDQQIVSTTGSSSVGLSSSMPDLDISIIPLNKTASPDHSTGSGEPKYAMLFKDEHGTTAKLVTKSSVTRSGSIGNSAIAMSTKTIAANIVNKQPVLGSVKSDKPIRCLWDNCTFQCDQNYKLRTHIRQVHEKVRPYLCDWPGCFGAYKTRSNLASHRMVHTGERPYICDYPKCGAKFARKYDCERHRRIHSEKMFACEWPGCGKRLCDPYNLERHMMVHKGELPFRCPISNCYRGFRELRYLRDHMVNTHKFLPDTNQLRAACLSSAKMSSISGYNLNDSSCSEPSPGGGAVGGLGMASDHSNNEILESLVNKIVNNQSNGSKNRTGQQTSNRLRQSTSSSTVNEDDDQQEKHHGSEPDEDSCSTIENEVYLDEQDQQEAKAESNSAQNGHQEHDENNNRTLASDDELKVQMDQSGPDDDEVLVIKKVTSQTTASSKRANLRSSLASTRPKRSRRY